MKTKSKLVLGLSILSAATLASATTATFAWYQAGGAAIGNGTQAATGALTVSNQTVTFGNLQMDIAVDSTSFTAADELVITDRAGRSYYVVGDNCTEILDTDNGSTTGDGHKQGVTHFVVTIKAYDSANSATQVDLDADMLAAAAVNKDVYTVKVTAAGSVKISHTKTTALGTGNNGKTALDPTTESAKLASGALGAALDQEVELLKIQISDAGVVSYWNNASESFSGNATGTASLTNVGGKNVIQIDTANIYYGLEVKNRTAEASPELISNSKMTPSMAASNSN